ncbi:hypothetical protein L7F22_017674 [Adiantum nelumboides]|nr:hypothetical protein [Adiantum nelumboides]MCO5564019.1 hypothetical protein [Adiantum nelumboides]
MPRAIAMFTMLIGVVVLLQSCSVVVIATEKTCKAISRNSNNCCKTQVSQLPQAGLLAGGDEKTWAILTINDFSRGGDDGRSSECNGKYHSNKKRVVALLTGWYKQDSRCGKIIHIHGNGRSTSTTVLDGCDSWHGCDSEHAGQPPCPNNGVDVSDAVWKALVNFLAASLQIP